MEKELIDKLKVEIEYQQEQFDLLYEEHFDTTRFNDDFYKDMIVNVNKSKGRTELILELLSEL